jgi:hypothetical protein
VTTPDWRNVITDARELKLFNALEHPQYVWRTLPALVRESGMNDTEVTILGPNHASPSVMICKEGSGRRGVKLRIVTRGDRSFVRARRWRRV